MKVYQDSCHYLYLPRLISDQVYKNAITHGLDSEDFFGYASGVDGDRYLGFRFGNGGLVVLDESGVLIDRDESEQYRERSKPVSQPAGEPDSGSQAGSGASDENGGLQPSPAPRNNGGEVEPVKSIAKRSFYGTIDLDPLTAKMKFADIVDEIVQQFTTKTGVNVSISVEIQADSKDGFDESLQRTIKENSNVLGFGSAEFED